MARVSIEDCLKKIPNRFELVKVGANRARQLCGNSNPHVVGNNREAVTALREIAEGFIVAKGMAKVITDTLEPQGEVQDDRVSSPKEEAAKSNPLDDFL